MAALLHALSGGRKTAAEVEPAAPPTFAATAQGAPAEPPAVGLAAAALAPLPEDAPTPDACVPRDARLLRLTGRHPFNCEPPPQELEACGAITTPGLHFVRNHGAVPRREWGTHTVSVAGVVDAPHELTMDQLVAMPARTVTVTMACAGNRRKEQNMHRKSQGFNWGPSGVSTAVWTGVMLRDVLQRCGLARARAGDTGRLHVHFAGPPGELPKGDGTYGTSIPLEYALNPANDVLLAYKMNGRWLTPDHGFPIRVILPGHIGGRTVKWLTRVEVRDCPSDNWYHKHDNRVPPPHVLTAEDAVAEGVWDNPDWVINHLNINSAITSPGHDALLPLTSATAPVTFKGYAYSGGGRKVTRVELSLDGGDTWRGAAIDVVEPPTKYGMHWAWVWWRLAVPTADLMTAQSVRLRAADSSMNTQPATLTWSLLGMMGNQHYEVRLIPTPDPASGAVTLRVQHPAQIEPGPLGNVGWREEEAAARAARDGPPTPPPSEAAAVPRVASGRVVTKAELEAHADEASGVWFAYRGRVYDGTPFLDAHPGGADSILIVGGQDATTDFDAIHSAKAKAMLDEYLVGDLVDGSDDGVTGDEAPAAAQDGAPAAAPSVALDPRRKVALPLVSKTVLTPNTRLFRFGLATPDTVLGLPVGKHIFLYGNAPHAGSAGTREVMRAYTPISSDADVGYVDFVIKVYDDSLGGGVMSRWLDALAVGDVVHAKGPVGHFVYTGRGTCTLNRRTLTDVTHMTFVAAGTGITPCYAVIRAALADAADAVRLTLIYANRHDEDVLLASELDALAAGSGGRFDIVYTLSRPSPAWTHRTGRIDAALLAEVVPPAGSGRLALLCGPHALVDDVCVPALAAMGYGEDSVVTF